MEAFVGNTLFRDVVEFSPEGVVLINVEGAINFINPAAKDLFSFFDGEYRGVSISKLFAPDEFEAQLQQNIRALLAQESHLPFIFGSLVKKTSSESFEVEIVMTQVADDEMFSEIGDTDKKIFAMYIRDVSVRKALTDQIQQQASLDALTRIDNRRSFYEKTQVEFRRSLRHPYPISLLIIGVDLFKNLNENHGVQAGDQVLIAFSDMLRQHMRDEDVCARMGNSEFAILLPHLSLSQARKVGEKLRHYVEHTAIQYGNIDLNFTISAGIVVWNKKDNFDEFIARGISALKNSIANGRNCLSEN